MVDRISRLQRSNNMSQIRSKNTVPEKEVRKYLTSIGFKYRLNVKKIPGSPDISNISKKIVIFVNGCFWHRHNCKKASVPKTNKEFWQKKFQDNVLRDKKNYKKLNKMGLNVFVIWECEIKNKKGFKKLDAFLNKKLH